MLEKKVLMFLLCLATVLGLSVAAARGADILFISAMDDATDPGGADDVLKVFMEGLGHTVTYFDDDESEADTEAAAAAADLVFISESVNSGGIRNEITEVEVPMIVNEMWAWDEMGLTRGAGADEQAATTNIEIVDPDHYLAAGLSGTVAFLTDTTSPLGACELGKGIAGDEAAVIATATLADGETYDILFVYEKGVALPVPPADSSPQIAADVRVCFGFHEFCGPVLTDDAYALLEAAIKYILGTKPQARNPRPHDGAFIDGIWANLSWSPGDLAASHDVYLSDNFDDVNDGTPGGPGFRFNQVDTSFLIGFFGYPYPEGLAPGTTYYWRIDELNDNEPNSPWKGNVWSFSVPPRTAYNPDPGDGAEYVDLDATLSWVGGFGAITHTFYIGDSFDDVNNATEGTILGAANHSPRPLEREKIYYWRVDEFNGFETEKGDIWAFTTPGAVGDPQPANGAADVQMNATLSWTAADNATSHELYFGTDPDAVNNATTTSPEYVGPRALGAENYHPAGLEWDSSYAWRVDEVYTTGTVKGLVWTFTTADFILVDDFEAYNDIDPPDPNSNTIYSSWLDGYNIPTNGALTSEEMPPYAEQTIVHGGAQSMKYRYDTKFMVCESTKTLTYPKDWTEGGVTKLSLWFRGNSANAAERMFVALGNAAVYHPDPAAAQITVWTEWVIDLQEFANQGVALSNVGAITIGFGTKGSPAAGGAGQVYFDDIRLDRQSVEVLHFAL